MLASSIRNRTVCVACAWLLSTGTVLPLGCSSRTEAIPAKPETTKQGLPNRAARTGVPSTKGAAGAKKARPQARDFKDRVLEKRSSPGLS
jgi:hypothetical protein